MKSSILWLAAEWGGGYDECLTFTKQEKRVMVNEQMAQWLGSMEAFFNRSTSCLGEEDSGFVPVEGMMTVAQQVAHVGWTVDWFIDGAFTEKGFDMDFAGAGGRLKGVKSLGEARKAVAAAFARAREVVGGMTMEQLQEVVADEVLFKGMPKVGILSAIDEHTAHHRGSLAVYSRLLGKEPKMPYMD